MNKNYKMINILKIDYIINFQLAPDMMQYFITFLSLFYYYQLINLNFLKLNSLL